MKENRVLIVTMVLNLIVAVTKVVSGIVFSFSTLIADSIQSFIDFLTDITSIVANKIGKRRANKTYPFGYGQVYYLANLFTGVLLFLIGLFILYQFFFFKGVLVPNRTLFYILLALLVLKLIVVGILKIFGKKYKSELIIEASKESYADFISTAVVMVVFILTILEDFLGIHLNIDKLGSLGMAIYVFYVAVDMIIQNVRGILTNSEANEEIKEDIIKELAKFEELTFKDIRVIKMSAYYSIFIQVKVDENLTIKEFLEIEKKIKNHLKAKNKLFRFVDVEPV